MGSVLLILLFFLGLPGPSESFRVAVSLGSSTSLKQYNTIKSPAAIHLAPRRIPSLVSSTRSKDDDNNNNDDDDTTAPLKTLSIGFLGCGTIASALVTGLLQQTSLPIQSIAVTRRSNRRSAALARAYSEVSVFDDNQSIVDASPDIIFLCVLPEQTSHVLEQLQFHPQQQLVSLVSTTPLEDLCRAARLPRNRVFRMICLPAVAHGNAGCLLLTPVQKDPPVLTALCQALGGVVQTQTEDEMAALQVVAGMMGPFYGVLRNQYQFLMSNGIASRDASWWIERMYHNMLQDVTDRLQEQENEASPWNIFDELIAEQTPGGLNEQALANLDSLGVLKAYDQVYATLLSRIRGESDGSLRPTTTEAAETETTAETTTRTSQVYASLLSRVRGTSEDSVPTTTTTSSQNDAALLSQIRDAPDSTLVPTTATPADDMTDRSSSDRRTSGGNDTPFVPRIRDQSGGSFVVPETPRQEDASLPRQNRDESDFASVPTGTLADVNDIMDKSLYEKRMRDRDEAALLTPIRDESNATNDVLDRIGGEVQSTYLSRNQGGSGGSWPPTRTNQDGSPPVPRNRHESGGSRTTSQADAQPGAQNRDASDRSFGLKRLQADNIDLLDRGGGKPTYLSRNQGGSGASWPPRTTTTTSQTPLPRNQDESEGSFGLTRPQADNSDVLDKVGGKVQSTYLSQNQGGSGGSLPPRTTTATRQDGSAPLSRNRDESDGSFGLARPQADSNDVLDRVGGKVQSAYLSRNEGRSGASLPPRTTTTSQDGSAPLSRNRDESDLPFLPTGIQADANDVMG